MPPRGYSSDSTETTPIAPAMILSKLFSTLRSYIKNAWERHWAIRNLEHILKEYGSDSPEGRECPIMTLKEVDGMLSLVDVLSFVNRAKSKGVKAALLTIPLSKTDPDRALFGKMLSRVMEQAQVATERLPDSPIRLFAQGCGAAVWRLSW